MGPLADTISGAAENQENPSRVSQAAPGGPAQPLPVGSPDLASVAKHGGNAGGRRRADGLVPNSPEAIAADRRKDRDRKAAARAVAKRMVEPAALPSAPVATAPAVNPPGASPVHAVVPDALAVAQVEPWKPEDLDETTALLVDVWEEGRLLKREKQCKEARLPDADAKEIVALAHFPDKAKKGLVHASGSVVAKALNAAGVSAKYRDVPLFLSSLALIVAEGQKADKRMRELIEAVNKPAKPEPPKA